MTTPTQVSHLPAWQHERDLRDDRAGIAVQVYMRTVPPRDKNDPPLIHRSYQIGSIDAQGQIRRHFYTRTSVDVSGLVTVHPFPVDALRALVAIAERDHVAEQQARQETLRGRTPQKRSTR